ncbi:hypothetical protein MMC28_004151 [Mycoblastus sanguinarius]|nr:hypothetical protein [Mycoblastus sanguinarius]
MLPLKDAALNQLQQASIQDTVSQAPKSLGKPSARNSDFTCTIYSLENKEYWGHDGLKPENVLNPEEVTTLPGIKLQDTKGFIAETALSDPALPMTFDGFRAT